MPVSVSLSRLFLLAALAFLTLRFGAEAQVSTPSECTMVVNGAGGDDHQTISAALASLPTNPSNVVICVKEGIYREEVQPTVGGLVIQAYPEPDDPEYGRRVVISGAEPLPWSVGPNDWEDIGGGVYKWTWDPDPSWDTQTDSKTQVEWFRYYYGSSHGPEYAQRRELLIAKVPGLSATDVPGFGHPDQYEGHVMQAVSDQMQLNGNCSNTDAGVCGTYYVETEAGQGSTESPPVAIYAMFPGGVHPSIAEPRIAVRDRGFKPLDPANPGEENDCGRAVTPGNYVLKGLVFRHTNNRAQMGAVCPGDESSYLEEVAVEFTNGTGIRTGNVNRGGSGQPYDPSDPNQDTGNDHVFVGVRTSANGQLGFGGQCNDCVFRDGEISDNNWKGYSFKWEAGGAKVSYSEAFRFTRVRAFRNRGPGIWFDIANRYGVVEGVWADENWDVGIFLEYFSGHTLVQHNVVTRTVRAVDESFSGAGIAIQVAPSNYVYHNTVVNNEGNGVYVRVNDDRTLDHALFGYPAWQGAETTFYNNIFVANTEIEDGAPLPTGGTVTVPGSNEVQIEEGGPNGSYQKAQSNTFLGNVYERHNTGDDAEEDQNQYAFRSKPAETPNYPGSTLRTNDPVLWRAEFGIPDNTEKHLSYNETGHAEVWQPDEWTEWANTFQFQNEYTEVRTSLPPQIPRAPQCYEIPGAHPEAPFNPGLLDGPAPPSTDCHEVPDGELVRFITGNESAVSGAAFDGKTVYVLPGAALTVSGQFVLKDDSSEPGILFILGTLTGTGDVTVEGGSELVFRPLSRNDLDGSIELKGAGSCLMVEAGASIHFRGDIIATDGGFIANRGGTLSLGANATLELTATAGQAQISPGSSFALGSSSDIVFRTPVTMHGTADEPIRFYRSNAVSWGNVTLHGDHSSLRNVEFDGGFANLVVHAEKVAIDSVTSTNGQYGLGISDAYGLSDATVTASAFTDNLYGIYGLGTGTSLYVSGSTVSDNTSRGVYLSGATATGFRDNVVEDNGGDGIHVTNDGYLSASDFVSFGSNNRVASNGGHEVRVGTNARAHLGTNSYNPHTGNSPNADACNSITSLGDGPNKYLVYNTSTWTARAEWNYLESAPPLASRFYGPVDYGFALASDPTQGGPCSGGPGAFRAPGGEVTASYSTAAKGTTASRPEALAAAMRVLRDSLREAPGHAQTEARASELYALSRLARDLPSERAASVAAFARLRSAAPSGRSRELGRLFVAGLALADGRTSDARRALDDAPEDLSPDVARALLGLRVSLLTQEDRPEEALRALDALEAAEEAVALAEGREAEDFAPTRQYLAWMAGDAETQVLGQPIGDASLATGVSAPSLGVPYPNPSRGTITIPLALSEPSTVEVGVYDVLGRRVALLAEGTVQAGRHPLSLSKGALAPGTYLVRMQVGDATTVRRFTIVR